MRLRYLVVSMVLALAALPARAQSFPLDSVRAILPAGTLRVDAMDVAASPRMQELSRKFQAAAQQNQEWFQQHLRSAQPGQPLAWDARLGLTREEYDEFLALATQMQLRKVGEAPLQVRAEGSTLVFDGGTGMPDLTGITIDLAGDRLVTPLGTVTGSREVHNDSAAAGMGPWDGRTWSLEEVSTDGRDGRVVSLSVGRVRENGRGILYTQMRQIQGGRPTVRMVRILMYDLPR